MSEREVEQAGGSVDEGSQEMVDPKLSLGFQIFNQLNLKKQAEETSLKYQETETLANDMLGDLDVIETSVVGDDLDPSALNLLLGYLGVLTDDMDPSLEGEGLKVALKVKALTKILYLCNEINCLVKGINKHDGNKQTAHGCDSENCVGPNSLYFADRIAHCLFCYDGDEILKWSIKTCELTGKKLILPEGDRQHQAFKVSQGSPQKREDAEVSALDKSLHFVERLDRMHRSQDQKFFLNRQYGQHLARALKPFLETAEIDPRGLFSTLIEIMEKQGNLEERSLTKKLFVDILFLAGSIQTAAQEVSQIGRYSCSNESCVGKSKFTVVTNCDHKTKVCIYCLNANENLQCRYVNCDWTKKKGLSFP